MKLLSLFNEERAVSPVIGVILMVAITVILAAVIGTFVLGLGSEQDTAPQAAFDFDYDAGADTLTVTHTGGNSFTTDNSDALELLIVDADPLSLAASISQQFDVSAGVSAGSQAIADDIESDDEASVKWTAKGGAKSQIVGTYTVA